MLTRKTIPILVVLILLSPSAFALSGIPSMEESEASMAFQGPGYATLMVSPGGDGPPFTEAHDSDGNVVDATITMYLRDSFGSLIANFPYEDIWLESQNRDLVPCIGGTNPDHSTDASGMTSWTNPLHASGYTSAPVFVFVNGSALTSNSGLLLRFNSPDIDANGTVGLSDLALFAGDFYSGGFVYRADFSGDRVLNLTDVHLFAFHYGSTCP